MSDLENFTVSEGNEGSDSGALERLREKMAQASAQIKKDQKQEARQVKKDDMLFNVLMEFLKHLPSGHPLVKSIVNCLSANLPSPLILAILSLNYKTIRQALAQSDQTTSALPTLQIPDKFNSFSEIINWIQLVVIHIQTSKESDKVKIYNNNQLSKYLQSLINISLTDFFNNKQELTPDQITTYTQDILQFISNDSNNLIS